jgi:hypothetical protein
MLARGPQPGGGAASPAVKNATDSRQAQESPRIIGASARPEVELRSKPVVAHQSDEVSMLKQEITVLEEKVFSAGAANQVSAKKNACKSNQPCKLASNGRVSKANITRCVKRAITCPC